MYIYKKKFFFLFKHFIFLLHLFTKKSRKKEKKIQLKILINKVIYIKRIYFIYLFFFFVVVAF